MFAKRTVNFLILFFCEGTPHSCAFKILSLVAVNRFLADLFPASWPMSRKSALKDDVMLAVSISPCLCASPYQWPRIAKIVETPALLRTAAALVEDLPFWMHWSITHPIFGMPPVNLFWSSCASSSIAWQKRSRCSCSGMFSMAELATRRFAIIIGTNGGASIFFCI